MGVRNVKRSELLRLQEKTLDAQFLTTIEQGLNCSVLRPTQSSMLSKKCIFLFLLTLQLRGPDQE